MDENHFQSKNNWRKKYLRSSYSVDTYKTLGKHNLTGCAAASVSISLNFRLSTKYIGLNPVNNEFRKRNPYCTMYASLVNSSLFLKETILDFWRGNLLHKGQRCRRVNMKSQILFQNKGWKKSTKLIHLPQAVLYEGWSECSRKKKNILTSLLYTQYS